MNSSQHNNAQPYLYLVCALLSLCMTSMVTLASESQGPSRAASTSAESGATVLLLDDGSAENAIGNSLGGELVWLNRLSLDAADLPFLLRQVQILFPAGTGVNTGELVDIYLYTDPDGDGDPATGMVLEKTIKGAAVQAVDGVTWSSFNLAPSLYLSTASDIIIAVVNRTAGTDLGEKPVALDQTASQGQSWVGINASGTIADPPVFPTDIIWSTTDALGSSGNWMIRASGFKYIPVEAKPVPSLTATGALLLTLVIGLLAGVGITRNAR